MEVCLNSQSFVAINIVHAHTRRENYDFKVYVSQDAAYASECRHCSFWLAQPSRLQGSLKLFLQAHV